jgi:hypothetical protein
MCYNFYPEDGGSRLTRNAVVTAHEGSQLHIPENRNPKIIQFYEYHTSGLELKENSFLFGMLPTLMNEGDAD